MSYESDIPEERGEWIARDAEFAFQPEMSRWQCTLNPKQTMVGLLKAAYGATGEVTYRPTIENEPSLLRRFLDRLAGHKWEKVQ